MDSGRASNIACDGPPCERSSPAPAPDETDWAGNDAAADPAFRSLRQPENAATDRTAADPSATCQPPPQPLRPARRPRLGSRSPRRSPAAPLLACVFALGLATGVTGAYLVDAQAFLARWGQAQSKNHRTAYARLGVGSGSSVASIQPALSPHGKGIDVAEIGM